MTVKEELDKLIEQYRIRGYSNLVIYLGGRARADLKAELTTRPEMGAGRLDAYRGYPISASKDPGAVFIAMERESEGVSVTLLDDARRLNDIHPFERGDCYACGSWWLEEAGDSHDPASHRPDCPVLALPRIVAALKAAEEMLEAHDHPGPCPTDYKPCRALHALAAALRGEKVTA